MTTPVDCVEKIDLLLTEIRNRLKQSGRDEVLAKIERSKC